ncbi:MAG: hypothetical protein IT383_14010 [Deltaproteobacteria bacterium]|nr:hypothetical protein [Deltaproteobacteria bacterium]
MIADPLAALLGKEGVLPQARVEEAQERQVLLGGTLDTALLELGGIDEATLLPLMERAYHARAVGKSELATVDAKVTALFPRRIAEKHAVVPVELSGRRLLLAVAGPPDLALLDEIGFMLSVYVRPAITTQARVAWALSRLYGVGVPPRLEAVLGRMGEHAEDLRAAAEAWHARPALRPAPSPALEPASPPTQASSSAPAAPDASGWSVAAHAGLDASAPSAPALSALDGGSVEAAASAKAAQLRAARDPEVRRRNERVLWTVDDAIAELALAEERDAMLDVVLRFAYRRLTTVAIFIQQRTASGPGFVGWDVIDPLLSRQDIAVFALPAEGNHGLGQVYSMRSPFLGPLKREDPLVRLFGRKPRAVVLMPILVGDRLLGVLYGDASGRSIPPSALAELHMVVPRLGKGLGNLILRKKRALRAQLGAPAAVVIGTAPSPASDEGQEQPIAVAARAPSRAMPTIDIDISVIDAAEFGGALEAPAGLSAELSAEATGAGEHAAGSNGGPTGSRSALLSAAPPSMPWADGKPDDEDVRLDEGALASLLGALSRGSGAPLVLPADEPTPRSTAPVEGAGADPELVARPRAPIDEDRADDEAVRVDDAMFAELTPRTTRTTAPVLSSIPDGEPMPPPEEPAAAPASLPGDGAPWERDDFEPAKSEDLAALLDETALQSAVAPSPGANARESLLTATHRAWLAHDDDDNDALVGRLATQGEAERRQALASVLAQRLAVLPSLARYFPGALAEHPFGGMGARPEVTEFSDCLHCLVRFGADLAAPILVAELDHEDRLHRYAAIWALSALRVPAALPRLALRVFDPEITIATLALEVLDGYRHVPEFDKVMAGVRDLVRRGDDFQRARAVLAAAELRDRTALPALVDLLGTKPVELSDDAHRALVEITKQDLGAVDRRWRAWIADNEAVPRTRWLIDGLRSSDEHIRRSSQAELNKLTGQYFGYRFDASRAERENGLQAWNEWWQGQAKDAPGRWP